MRTQSSANVNPGSGPTRTPAASRRARWLTALLVAMLLLSSLSATLLAQSNGETESETATAESATESETATETESEEAETPATAPELPEVIETAGVLIVDVLVDSPAAEAGLARGDIILSVDDAAVNDAEALLAAITAAAPGDTLTLEWQHGAETRSDAITLDEQDGVAFLGIRPHYEDGLRMRLRDHIGEHLMDGNGPRGMLGGMMMGHMFLERNAALDDVEGLVILEVGADSPAADAGLTAGDIIVSVAGEPLTHIRDLQALLAELAPGDGLVLEVAGVETAEAVGEDAAEEDALDSTVEITTETVTVTLAAAEDDEDLAFLGVRVAPATPQLEMRGQLDDHERGMYKFHMRPFDHGGRGMMDPDLMESGMMEPGMMGRGMMGRFFNWHSDDEGFFGWGFPLLRMWQFHMPNLGFDMENWDMGDGHMFRFFMGPEMMEPEMMEPETDTEGGEETDQEAIPFEFETAPRGSDFF